MNKFLNLKIYIPNKLFLEEVVAKVSVYGKEGFYTILPNHIDYVSSFEDSILIFTKNDGKSVFIGINQGVLIKCGREVQLSTFNAVYGGESVEALRAVLKNAIEKDKQIREFEMKIKNSLKNIEYELFKKVNNLKKYE